MHCWQFSKGVGKRFHIKEKLSDSGTNRKIIPIQSYSYINSIKKIS